MHNSNTDLDKARDKKEESKIHKHIPISSEKPIQFQIFFLTHDQNQVVEVVETDEIDYGEIIQHQRIGESAFIHKKLQMCEFSSKLKIKRNQNPSYFNRC